MDHLCNFCLVFVVPLHLFIAALRLRLPAAEVADRLWC